MSSPSGAPEQTISHQPRQQGFNFISKGNKIFFSLNLPIFLTISNKVGIKVGGAFFRVSSYKGYGCPSGPKQSVESVRASPRRYFKRRPPLPKLPQSVAAATAMERHNKLKIYNRNNIVYSKKGDIFLLSRISYLRHVEGRKVSETPEQGRRN
jgi:hypothetical protein